MFEDEKEKGGAEEREFLERVRSEVALPEYDNLWGLQRDGDSVWLCRIMVDDMAFGSL